VSLLAAATFTICDVRMPPANALARRMRAPPVPPPTSTQAANSHAANTRQQRSLAGGLSSSVSRRTAQMTVGDGVGFSLTNGAQIKISDANSGL
jgi:hypothetical protein